MRVLTWNLHAGHAGHAAAQAAALHGADLALLQEVVAGPAHAGALADGWPHAAFARARGRFGGGAQGNLLLSHRPIDSWTGYDVSNHPFERRVGLHAVVDGIHVVAVHLDLSGLGRRLQWHRLLQLLPTDGPLILAGDCNDWSLQLDRALSAYGLVEAHRAQHGRLALSWPARLPLLALDRIYVRGLHVRDAGRLHADGASDHHGIWAELGTP